MHNISIINKQILTSIFSAIMLSPKNHNKSENNFFVHETLKYFQVKQWRQFKRVFPQTSLM